MWTKTTLGKLAVGAHFSLPGEKAVSMVLQQGTPLARVQTVAISRAPLSFLPINQREVWLLDVAIEVEELQPETVTDHQAWQTMGDYGGGFAKALAAAWFRADGDNRARLNEAFKDYVEEYREIYRQLPATVRDGK